MPGVKGRTGQHGRQGRKRTDIRNLTATPPELQFSEPVIGWVDVTIHFCPQCGAAWWEPATITYTTATEQPEPDANGYYYHVVVEATTEQAEHHYKRCPLCSVRNEPVTNTPRGERM